jgi:outer membrane protein, heavy metal efflux system
MRAFFLRSPQRRARAFSFAVSIAAILALPAQGMAQPATSPTLLTVDEAMQRLWSHPSIQGNLEARRQIAQGLADSEGLWPNPEVVYERESLPRGSGTTEEYLLFRQRIEPSGRLGLLSEAAELDAKAERLRIQADAKSLRAKLLGDFYGALYFQARVEVLGVWQDRLARILASVEARQAAGDVSGYDRARVASELASLRRTYDNALNDMEFAKRWLISLLAGDQAASFRVTGLLAPVTEPALLQPEAASLPQIAAYRYEAEAAEARASANGRWWLPAINLQGGAKRISGFGATETGYVAGAGIEIPLFDRAQGARGIAVGKARLAESQRVHEERLLDAQLTTLSHALDRKVELLRQYAFKEDGEVEILRSAEAAYLEGEFGVVELLDGYRTHFQEELEQLELSWSARQTWLALVEITGL